MKISIEFTSMRDLLTSMPKFFDLIGGSGTPEERFAQAMDGGEEGTLVLQAQLQEADPVHGKAKDPKPAPKKAAEPDLAPAPEKAPEPAPRKAAEPAPQASRPSEAEVRKEFNALIQAGKRDTLKEILKGFGAANFSGLNPDNYAAAIEQARMALQEG